MREILFRGKDIVGNWYAGNLAVIKQDFHNGAGTIKAGSYISNECGSPFAYQIRPETVGQFTGLTDKNGVKIFEGDILGFHLRHSLYGTVVYEHSGFEFVWDEETARVKHEISMQWIPTNLTMWEVIGNIHK